MPDAVVDALKAARKCEAEERLRFGEGWLRVGHVRSQRPDRAALSPNLLTFRRGKLLDELRINRVRLHGARHSCATLTHLRNVHISAVITARLGHASAAFTMSRYTQPLMDDASSFGRVVTRDKGRLGRMTQRARTSFTSTYPVPPVGLEPTLGRF